MKYFINEGDIQELSSISKNVDSHLVVPHIKNAEIMHIKHFLGVPFYEDLKAKLNNDTLSNIEKEFINDYLRTVHVHYAIYQAFPFLFAKVDNKGIVFKSANGSETASEKFVVFLRKEIEDMAEFFKLEAHNWLVKNATDFPLYKTDCNKENEIFSDLIAFDEKPKVSQKNKWIDNY